MLALFWMSRLAHIWMSFPTILYSQLCQPSSPAVFCTKFLTELSSLYVTWGNKQKQIKQYVSYRCMLCMTHYLKKHKPVNRAVAPFCWCNGKSDSSTLWSQHQVKIAMQPGWWPTWNQTSLGMEWSWDQTPGLSPSRDQKLSDMMLWFCLEADSKPRDVVAHSWRRVQWRFGRRVLGRCRKFHPHKSSQLQLKV